MLLIQYQETWMYPKLVINSPAEKGSWLDAVSMPLSLIESVIPISLPNISKADFLPDLLGCMDSYIIDIDDIVLSKT